MESIINDLYLRLTGEHLATETNDHHLKNFILISKDEDGSLLHGFVKQVTPEDYHVFVREKDAIVGYRKQGAGVMSCIMGDDNQPWVRSIGRRLAIRVA